VVPRVAAGFLMFPVIVVFANLVAIFFGLVTSMALLGMSPQTFMRGARLFYKHFDIIYSIIKSFSFGLVITTIGCYQGFNTRGGAEGVGVSTTRAVVISGMLILVLDAFWAATILKQ
jgi:phospholipid/cholesterol/gamma-HCH transport system permease protein